MVLLWLAGSSFRGRVSEGDTGYGGCGVDVEAISGIPVDEFGVVSVGTGFLVTISSD